MMKIVKGIVCISLLSILCYCDHQRDHSDPGKNSLENNKNLVREFYKRAFTDRNPPLAAELLTDDYIQHNPFVKTGKVGFLESLPNYLASMPKYKPEIKGIWAEGDRVMIHVFGENAAGEGKDEAVVDIYRIEKDKIAEHWDVIQPIPEDAVNPMF